MSPGKIEDISSPQRSIMISSMNSHRNSPQLFIGGTLGLDNLITQLNEEDELDFMIDVSYILIYISDTLTRKLTSIDQLLSQLELKTIDYQNLS